MKTGTEQDQKFKPREARLAFYHPNGSGSGAAMQLELRLAREATDRSNCFFLDMAPQKTAGVREGDHKALPTFDWEHKITVKLDFADVCELLLVLEGRVEKAGGQRNGLFHDNGRASTVIGLQKAAEKGGFFLNLSRKDKTDGQLARVGMALSDGEAIGLRCVFQTGLFFLACHGRLFGLPGGAGERAAQPAA